VAIEDGGDEVEEVEVGELSVDGVLGPHGFDGKEVAFLAQEVSSLAGFAGSLISRSGGG
jgi:hypothetical protein